MATKTKPGEAIRDLYNAGIREVNRIMMQGDPAQQAVAEKTLDDLTATMLAHTLESVQGRTALITGLIAELTEIIGAVETQPPYASAVGDLTKVLEVARKHLESEKKLLLET